MNAIHLLSRRGGPLRIVCLGAHSDDIEIGCGGTLLELISWRRDIEFVWVVFSAAPNRAQEAQASAARFLKGAKHKQVFVKNFRESYFPFVGAAIKDFFEDLKQRTSPDLVFTHYRHDRHQDHRTISDLTWNTWRSHLILEYEILKYDGDLGSPNLFVPLSRNLCERKVKYLCECFQTQSNKGWFTADTFRALLRLRGVECAAEKYAEAFYCRKLVCSFLGKR